MIQLPIDEKILIDALEKWGDSSQIYMAIEECGELIVALSHSFRNSKNPNIITEIADVLITVNQLRLIFGEEKVDEEIKLKQERLKLKLYK